MATVTIERRYCGPPQSANGGYTCGLTAAALGSGPREVTLVSPPPIGRPLELIADGHEARLTDGPTVVAVATRSDLELELPPAPSFAAAVAAADEFDLQGYRRSHIYPTCFTCGPDRDPDDGLRIFSTPGSRPGVFMWPWVPREGVRGADGGVDERIVWAALDCPSAHAWIGTDPSLMGIVLGRMAAVILRRPQVHEQIVSGAWTIDRQGRKLHAAAALWSDTGEVLAWSRTTWIVLTGDQLAAFAGTT